MVERGISYHFTNMDDPKLDYGSLFTWRDWDSKPAAINDTINKQIPFGNLAERLATTFPYPSHPPLPKYGASDSFGYIGFREIDPQDSTVTYAVVSQSKAWLHVSTPTEVFKTRYGMLMTYTYPRTGIPSVLLDVSPLSFTVPAGKYDSEPMEIGTHGGELHQYGGIVEFTHTVPPVDYGWDDTGTDPWQALTVGEVVDRKLRFAASLPQEVADLLELRPAIGDESVIQVVSQDLTGPDGPVFKLEGLAPTGPEGAAVQLRLKGNPASVFAVLRVHVFKLVEVPVSIFRIWDSRVPESDFDDGPTDNDIMIALAATFPRQGGIVFNLHPTSRKVDLRYDPTKPDTAPDQPLIFEQDGSFPYSASLEDLDRLTEKQSPAPARITIHIVKKYGNGLEMIGGSLERLLISVISSTAKPLPHPNGEHYVFAHEMGHLLGLSTKAVGQSQTHDRGPWPAPWISYRLNGLMHEDDANGLWIRHEDWRKAADRVIERQLNQPR